MNTDFLSTFGLCALVLALESIALLAVGSYTRSASTTVLGMATTIGFLVVAYILIAGGALAGGVWVLGR